MCAMIADALLENLARPAQGVLYDLDPGRFPGMPIWAGHPPFQVITYRTPAGIRNQADQDWLRSDVNEAKVGLISEMVMSTQHSGAHMDALGHITIGEDGHWSGGNESEHIGDFGVLKGDGSELPMVITRGVMVDVAKHLGKDRLDKGYPISAEDFDGACDASGIQLKSGDAVLVRTGQMSVWPNKEKMAETAGAGITKPVADLCAEAGVVVVGADTEACEVMPSVLPGHPHPVHERLLIDAGIHILENIYLEELSRDDINEFLFLALPAKITGATGGMLRPVAII